MMKTVLIKDLQANTLYIDTISGNNVFIPEVFRYNEMSLTDLKAEGVDVVFGISYNPVKGKNVVVEIYDNQLTLFKSADVLASELVESIIGEQPEIKIKWNERINKYMNKAK